MDFRLFSGRKRVGVPEIALFPELSVVSPEFKVEKGWAAVGLGLAIVVLLAIAPLIAADKSDEERPPSGIFSLYVENDVFAGTDRGYTNGLRFVWVSLDLNAERDKVRLPGWLDWLSSRLPLVQPAGARRFVSFSVGQNIYTPEDILSGDPDPDDDARGVVHVACAVQDAVLQRDDGGCRAEQRAHRTCRGGQVL